MQTSNTQTSSPRIPRMMKAAAIDRFGGPEVLQVRSLPVPRPSTNQVLIQLGYAGIGVWDPYVREGKIELGRQEFPRVIGSDGAGTVVAVGSDVKRFKVGDPVYAFANSGGFYAEYVAVPENDVALVPASLDLREAGALGADGITALRGVDDQLRLKAGEKLMIYGASGGIGHIALQLAKRIGARVLAVASQEDGLALVRRLGADEAVDGHRENVANAVRIFAPDGLDAALVLTAGEGLDDALKLVKKSGRIAHPNGVEPVPSAPDGVRLLAYDGTPSPEAFDRLNRLIGEQRFHVELGHTYRLDEAASAHRELERHHHVGKLALEIRAS
jgi:NADPH2:quinone reductase